ncbi:vesicle transport v-SNARE protein, putative [Plasmodium gallinaceum]|uniref:Vesicle transport v-SNARE protein, putative n=1 Tax=Plasmodium gallinaceum TaxID=5849 RepID=A0A1J1GSG0_PLAGA|nr:vesicle transport v-SNARE protein, putative [Plasmodium gallinaceum]CRG95364.1 vesicle transport v-SNARE protein, putative [Plasmodium gallinaceum]
MITYSEYLDVYVRDFNIYMQKIKNSIFYIKNQEDYKNTKEYILEAEKCIKQIIIEINSLPKGSHKIFEDINKYNLELKKYKNILEKMSDSDENSDNKQLEITRKYIEGSKFLLDSEKRAQDVEDIGYTIMSELNSQRNSILRTKHYTDVNRQEQNRVKRMLINIYKNRLLYKFLLILTIILLVIANIGVIIYKIK